MSVRFPVPPPFSLSTTQHKPFTSIPYGRGLFKRININNYNDRRIKINVASSSSSSGGQNTENVVADKHLADDDDDDDDDEKRLPEGLRRELLPRHVAVILDGNRRWGQQRGLPLELSHRSGAKRMIELTTLCHKWGVKVLTVFAFSTENWTRPQEEVDILMKLFGEVTTSELAEAASFGVRLSVMGDKSKLPKILQKFISEKEEATKDNSRLHLIVAINYGGQYDITQACGKLAEKVKAGLVRLEEIDNNLIEQELFTNLTEHPNPDLLIRSSGEVRISNFMLWQLAHTELYFVNKLWPDFEEADFAEALKSFQQRQRDYGGRS